MTPKRNSKYNPVMPRKQNPKVAIYTLGCKLNQAETESLTAQLSQAGYQPVPPQEPADICIANTCTITHIADRKSRHWLRLARRRNPGALVIAAGCYAGRAPGELAPLADLVLDNAGKERLVEIITGLPSVSPSVIASPSLPVILRERSDRRISLRVNSANGFPKNSANFSGEKQSHFTHNARVRSLVKVQDGCTSRCAYCIVPEVRTVEFCLPAPEIIATIKEKTALGYKEVVLTGTKIGGYKDDGADLAALVEQILATTGIERLRLSSLQPQEISPALLALWQDKRLCPHFHLALQSGSDNILRRMRRRYSRDGYQQAISLITREIPRAAITTDIMVGFPGESEGDFEQSYRFCQEAGFASIHVFPFSPRPGTEAAAMPRQVSDKVKRERTRKMLELAQSCRQSFQQRFLGQTLPVLWERETSPGSGIYSGLTDNYIRVFTTSERPLVNEILPLRLGESHFENQG